MSSWAPPGAIRKPVITSSKISRAPCSVHSSRIRSSSPHCGGTRPMLAAYGSHMTAASSCSANAASSACLVVPRHHHCVGGGGGGHARRGGKALGGEAGAGLGEEAVDVPVVGAGELEHLVAPGGRARQPQRAHRRLGARRGHAQHVDRRHARTDELRELDLGCRRRAEGGAALGRIGDGLDHLGMGMAVDQRPPRADVVDVGVAVDVGDLRALGTVDEQRVAPDRAHRPHRRVDAARKQELRPPVQLGGADVRQGGGQARSSSQRRNSSVK